jgi:hypothetical protein
MCLTRDQLYALVLEAGKKVAPFNPTVVKWVSEGTPSIDWFRGFLRRYPDVSQRVSDKLDSARASLTPAEVNSFYLLLADIYCQNPHIVLAHWKYKMAHWKFIYKLMSHVFNNLRFIDSIIYLLVLFIFPAHTRSRIHWLIKQYNGQLEIY